MSKKRGLNLRLMAFLTLSGSVFRPWALANTSLICIFRYTCILHCIVMLILLCKDFYCYLLDISLPHPHFILPWTSCLELGELLQFSTSMISPSIGFSSKGNDSVHFWPILLNCKLQKYLFKSSTPVPGDLVGHLLSLGWRRYC